mgnify:CR=1 FL=1
MLTLPASAEGDVSNKQHSLFELESGEVTIVAENGVDEANLKL